MRVFSFFFLVEVVYMMVNDFSSEECSKLEDLRSVGL